MVALNKIVMGFAMGTGVMAGGPARPPPPRTELICETLLGPWPTRHIPRYTKTKTKTLTATKRVTKIPPPSTVTPPRVTKTASTTTTLSLTVTAATNTDTITITETDTQTVTNSEVVTDTETDTVTVDTTITTTSTIPAPAGFTPISQEDGYVAKREAALVDKRSTIFTCKGGPGKGRPPQFYPPLYPEYVECLKIVEPITTHTVTVTGKGRTTTLHPATTTSTSTVTQTIVSTSYPPDATVTTSTTTDTSTTITAVGTSTTTVTATATNTIAIPTTVYRGCLADNIVSTANGGQQIERFGTTNTFAQIPNVAQPQDCCLSCFTSPSNCRGSVLIGTTCYLVFGTTCLPGQYQSDFFTTNSGQTDTFYVSNGPCGAIKDAGNA